MAAVKQSPNLSGLIQCVVIYCSCPSPMWPTHGVLYSTLCSVDPRTFYPWLCHPPDLPRIFSAFSWLKERLGGIRYITSAHSHSPEFYHKARPSCKGSLDMKCSAASRKREQLVNIWTICRLGISAGWSQSCPLV